MGLRKRTKALVVTAAAVIGIATMGVGWAYFTETTIASAGNGANGDMDALVQGTPSYAYDNTDNTLWPGHSATVRIPLTNNNPVPVEIVQVTAGAASGGCAANLSLSASSLQMLDDATPTPAATTFQIPAGKTYTLVITNGVTMSAAADNACEGSNFATTWNIKAENR